MPVKLQETGKKLVVASWIGSSYHFLPMFTGNLTSCELQIELVPHLGNILAKVRFHRLGRCAPFDCDLFHQCWGCIQDIWPLPESTTDIGWKSRSPLPCQKWKKIKVFVSVTWALIKSSDFHCLSVHVVSPISCSISQAHPLVSHCLICLGEPDHGTSALTLALQIPETKRLQKNLNLETYKI